MAEITKLSVGQAIDKLRGTDPPKAKMARLDEKIDMLDEETQRLRAMRRRIERDQRAGSTGRDDQKANARHVTKLKISGIIFGIVIVIAILAWMWGGFIAAANKSDFRRPPRGGLSILAMTSNECPLLAVVSTGHCNTARSLSAGVSNPKVSRGR